ncbi:hypothetical protein BS78_01G202500 [Paspalum vaginatum]|nr:hypothetical protein BS78_01G202500 [Paspalum vaginatum]
MGNYCVNGASSEQVTFKWSIDNFRALLDKGNGWTNSTVFEIMDHRWLLKLNPMDRNSSGEECVSLSLQLSRPPVEHSTIVEATFRIFIYDYYTVNCEFSFECCFLGKTYGRHSFQRGSISSGKSCMIPLATLKNSYGFILNDSCVFGVEFIEVITTKAKVASEALLVQNTSSVNKGKTYTWQIQELFAVENPCNSPEFERGGYKWSICLKKYGNHISLDLQMINDLPKDSGILVKFTLSIKDNEGCNHMKATGRGQFSDDARGWGWQKFVLMENLKGSSNDHLITTQCCIEAEIAVIGSSKMNN